MLLCMPSPACIGKVGQKVGRVDSFGDNVTTEPLIGDTWRTQHDVVKTALSSLCRYAGVTVTTEVYGVFAHLIQQEPLNRVDSARNRQTMVPDFKIELLNTYIESHLAKL